MSEPPSAPDADTDGAAEDVIEVEPVQYFWTDDADEHRRCFVVECLSGTEYGVAYFEEVFQWIKTGAVPARSGRKALKVVDPT